jgi:DnaJ-class molecular chaperone
MNKEFWLRLLGLTGNVNLPEIKKAWKKRANETHPDHGGSKEDFIEVTHAYKMLTDESYQRREAGRARERTLQDLTLNMKVHIEWSDAFYGRSITVSWNQVEVDEKHSPLKTEGKQELHTITINIPEGFSGGSFQFASKGLKKGEEFGDCHVQVIVLADPRYTLVSEIDIACSENIPLDMFLKGGKIEIQTPWGLRKMTVKPGTLPGSNIVIKKAGAKKLGSLIVRVMPKFPGEEELRSEKYSGMKIEWDIKDENDEDTFSTEEANIIKDFMNFMDNGKT